MSQISHSIDPEINSIPPEISGLRRVFLNGFFARDIAEPLQSLDEHTSAAELHDWFENKQQPAVSIRREGDIVGYVQKEHIDLDTNTIDLQLFSHENMIAGDTTLSDVILRLSDTTILFVTAFNSVAGMIRHDDLQKPPLRMWLFGLITIIEMRWSRMIDEHFDDSELIKQLSPGRMEKAEALFQERKRRHQNPRLLECIQFSEKGQIVAKTKELRARTIFKSRREMKTRVKEFEGLRNNLAHSQDILALDWHVILELTRYISKLWDSPVNNSEED